MTNTNITTTVERYIAAWNETDATKRRDLVAAVFADDATYVDPMMEGAGPDVIDGLIAAAQQQFAGHTFALVGAADAHHDRVRFTWRLMTPDGQNYLATGYDYATVADDGRLRDVTGFLEMNA